ncbi:hypothetical protein LOTGIDRAFT_123168 [Lottia gigantea]|uniref:heparosan-N-sulfate-glucuronate 5-epimerase n=1 Tax=Lottia gigantea TaxID=225164 RepID=V4A647_LOTGI|nr:hypothetical protein LOTGIDRAFT_123168 [Lottia gigantea]ESO90470.1 hypothetical protein LOTGIDRAFT_123168 [Lottia gigantea]
MPIKYHELDCVINGEYSIKCRRDGNEVFIPFFGFIQKYFEIYGKLSTEDGYERLEWEHSYSTVHRPREKYSPAGVFMSFEYYNVEERDRVRCISAMEGVPLSTQWTQNGHYYPIQISQFGLSHLSKYLTQPEAEVVTLEDGEDELESWILPDKRSQIELRKDPDLSTTLVEFTTSDSLKNPGISLPVDEKEDFVLSADIKFATDGSITVTIDTPGLQLFYIHYVLSSRLIFLDGHDIYYGLGDRRGQWMHITRDIAIDFDKGLALKYNKSKRTKMKLKVSRIKVVIVRGHGWLDNLTLSTTAHLDHFYNAANWLVLHQNDRGGWPISVQRKLIPKVLELEPGWYSAMAQGQAMSLLVRAYLRSHNTKYIQAAVDAMKLFEIPSMQGGVLAKYADRYDWYEEYPTTPSSFVLNGFIYSLFGLYDLKEVTSGEESKMAERLYNKGIESLKHMLLMFDNGSGTFYDLRHITLGIAPNRARWDYHTTHINQLLQLSVMDDSEIFKVTAQRWMDYMKGKRAKHN